MRDLRPCPDALERHLRWRDAIDTQGALPAAVSAALAQYDRVAHDPSDTPLDALRAYTATVDRAAHEGDLERDRRTLASLDPQSFCSAFAPTLNGDSSQIAPWIAALTDGEARVRTLAAYARDGQHCYSLAGGALAQRWDESFVVRPAEHALVRGARWYFDAIFLHPFDDGNARLARALLVASIHDRGAIDVAGAVWLDKQPGETQDFWRLVRVCALSAERRAQRRYHHGP